MNSENISIICRVLFNREAFLSMILPALLYGVTYKFFGLTEAIFISGTYAFVVSFILKSTKYIAFIFALFGLLEIGIVSFIPDKWLLETVFIKSLVGTLQTSIVFLLFSLVSKPLPQLFAEAASPELKLWDFSQSANYVKIWQKVSFIWIAAYLTKALILLSFYPLDEDTMVTLNVLLGWPVHIGLIVFSVPYVRNQFRKYEA
ncbi:DUF3159 domain-containing protein [Vibrio vulnificus]|nr:DUF3159 domain-containing protein [Vibrio vulnificus]EHD0103428.1 DUF3159 domain-containing protein [Vibrio vulnificus]EKA7356521.1 DUF3159 domain-containing protein [Vibrio vulnificus]